METVKLSKEELFEGLYEDYKFDSDVNLRFYSYSDGKLVKHPKPVPYSLDSFISIDSTLKWQDTIYQIDGYTYDEDSGNIIDEEDHIESCYLEYQEDFWFKNTGFVDGKEVIIDWVD